jgi:histidinol dehydrogenase
MSIKICNWSVKNPSLVVEKFLKRPAFAPEAEICAAEVLADIQRRGNAAVLAAVKKFDGASLKVAEMQISKAELAAAVKAVSPRVKRAVRDAHTRVKLYAEAGMRDG